MAYEFWGQTPETTTVSASPTPTTTAFTVGDATNLLEDQWVLVQVDGDFERVQITDKTGNALTVNPPLSDSPDTPGEVRSGRQLIKNSLLNSGHVGNATIAELEAADMSVAPAGVKAFVQERGIYRWAPGDSSTPDGESVVENADGRFLLEVGTNNPGPGGLAELVQRLLLRVQALETAQFVTGTTPASVHSCAEDLQSVSATAATVTRIPLPLRNAVGFTAKAGDMALVQLSEGYRYAVSVSAVVSKDNVLMLHITNPTASAIAMLSQKVVVTIIKQGAAVYGLTKN